MNPYSVLNIPRDADKDAIKAAYRSRSMALHPDKGGSEEEFNRLKLAYDVDGNALQFLVGLMTQLCAEAELDRRPKLLELVEEVIGKDIKAITNAMENNEKIAKRLEKVARRISRKSKMTGVEGPNMLGMAFLSQAAGLREGSAKLKESIKLRTRAVEMLRDYRFDPDTSAVPGFFGEAPHFRITMTSASATGK
jgi:hypothetical protein